MKPSKTLLYMVAFALLLLPTVSPAKEGITTQPKLIQDRKLIPSALLTRSYRYIERLQHFSIDALTMSDDYYLDKMIITYTHRVHIDMQRPNRMHIVTSGDLRSQEYFIDNTRFSLYDRLTNYYATIPIPRGVDRALDYLFEKFNVKSPLANLLYSNLSRRISPKSEGEFFGISEIGGKPCYHLGFADATHAYQVWIAQGDQPLILKFSIIDKTLSYLPRSTSILQWHLNTTPASETFTFTPPDKAKRIEIIPAAKKETL